MSSQESILYGLIGYPVTHSISPLMHNAAFKHFAINAEYKLFEIKPEGLEDFVSSLHRYNSGGLNVTIPHKEKVIPLLDRVSPEAELFGAVNTIRIGAQGLEGFNTDGKGFLTHLTHDLHFNPQGKTIALLGAGGAAKAVVVSLAQSKPKKIAIFDVDTEKAKALVGHLRVNFRETAFTVADSVEGLSIEQSQLLVNATPVGMKAGDPCLVDEKLLHKDLLVYDVIYNPKETKLLKVAHAKGARTSNGLGMLLYQGVAAFEIWTGKPAPVELMRRALEEGVKTL